MLSPRYLDGLGDELADIYAQLEADILADMARRLAKLGKITEATKWQAEMLAQTGALKKNVNRIIKKYDPKIQREIKAVYNDAMVKNARANNRIFEDALGHGVSDSNAQAMLAGIARTHSDLSRLTLTTAYTTEQQFVQQANASYMQTVSGAMSYDAAMKNACDNLAKDGISGVQYRNGKPVRLSIEAAVRMNILTGVNQTAAAVTMADCEELGCDLVETSAHIGARPSHEAWQGKIFSLSGTSDKYPPFSVCGLGEIDGICGINCRHSYYPYFEGTERHYSTDDLDEMAAQTVTYDGQEMTRYDAEEKLRYMERNVRKYKRRAIVQEAGGVDNTAAREKIGEWQTKIKDFTKQTGVARDRAREFVGTIDGTQPRGIFDAATQAAADKLKPTGAPTPAAPAAPAAASKGVKVDVSGFTDAFTKNKINTESTAELIKYINAQPYADDTVKELFNYMNNSSLSKGVTIRNSQSGHKLTHYSNGELQLTINKLLKNDANIIGKAGTNIHEIGHLLDTLGADAGVNGQGSFIHVREAIKKARKYNSGEIPTEVAELFKKKSDEIDAIQKKIFTERTAKHNILSERYKAGEIGWKEYSKQWDAINRAAKLEADLAQRDAINGVDALMDIYDALSEGRYQHNHVVVYGHGTSYYFSELAHQAAEIWANYTRLSITNPELVAMLRKYEPELVEALEKNATELLNNLRGTK